MKLKFDANLQYQDAAVQSAVRLFEGRGRGYSVFTVDAYNGQASIEESISYAKNKKKNVAQGIGNKKIISDEELLENLRRVQLENNLPQSKTLPSELYFDIEMETGTGKTYVYIKTILELNKQYGFTKFIIVVPSVAIKEGVMKTFEMTKDHFSTLYSNIPYKYFVYDRDRLQEIREFAISDIIQIMIINIDSFNKSDKNKEKKSKNKENKSDDTKDDEYQNINIIHKEQDLLNGMRPIELIQETNPIVIIDEPQSVDNTETAQEAINNLNPLCRFRYSATFRKSSARPPNFIYKLDAVDSYDLGLVKQIEVASFYSDNSNFPYIKLKSVNIKKGTAILVMDVIDKKTGKLKQHREVSVKPEDDLYEKSGRRDIYTGYSVERISWKSGDESIRLSKGPEVIRCGEEIGAYSEMEIKRHLIQRTIKEHLDKELILNPKGIKVLSLFFIDKVSNYYGTGGPKGSGIYGQIFEEEYKRILEENKTKYQKLKHYEVDVSEVHGGYFSHDKNSVKDSKERSTSADKEAFNLIMKDKERLLSFSTPLRFIFSHSALAEGWDNPNVFQICTLVETKNELTKRQKIGRGLRLCVNQQGERLHDPGINILTVMANESYEEFANSLQHEYEEEGGIKFGVLESHAFANIKREIDGVETPIGEKKSAELFNTFVESGYLDKDGRIQDNLKEDLIKDSVRLPEEFEEVRDKITSICKKAAGRLNIKDASKKTPVKRNKAVYLSPEFKELWDKIKYKTIYSVQFDSDKLIQKCARELRNLTIQKPKDINLTAELQFSRGGINAVETVRELAPHYEKHSFIPDIVMYLQSLTKLTRKTITRLLIESGTLDKFLINPQRYMEEAGKIILSEMQALMVEGIKYTKLGEEEYYAMELIFKDEILTGYLGENLPLSTRSVYDHVLCDSDVEKSFAAKFENDPSIKLYAKLPDSFVIPTPLGNYNPDWAVLVEKNGVEKLYFVIETKGSTNMYDLRYKESWKIKCGAEHFKALNTGIKYDVASNPDEFMDNL